MDLDHELNTRTYTLSDRLLDRHALYDDRRHGDRHHRDLWPLRRYVIRLRGIRRNDTRPAASIYANRNDHEQEHDADGDSANDDCADCADRCTAATATLTTCITIAAASAARRDQFRIL